MEPFPDEVNSYRTAALKQLEIIKAIDLSLSTSPDARLAWVTVAITFGLTSTRGWTLAATAKQIGLSESKLTHSKAKFLKLMGLDASSAHLLLIATI